MALSAVREDDPCPEVTGYRHTDYRWGVANLVARDLQLVARDLRAREIAVVCRYPQFFAARKLKAHILTALRCRDWLGSPTILLIVDREDLESQAGRLFCNSRSYLQDNEVRVFESREELACELKARRTGGFYITTVQKFTESTGTLSGRLLDLLKGVDTDKRAFKALGITFEEKAFYDILVSVRDTHKFAYPDEQCKTLAKKIKELVDGTSVYADWLNNDNLKNQLATDLTTLLYEEGYPPEWDEEVFNRVLEQMENYKRNR